MSDYTKNYHNPTFADYQCDRQRDLILAMRKLPISAFCQPGVSITLEEIHALAKSNAIVYCRLSRLEQIAKELNLNCPIDPDYFLEILKRQNENENELNY